MHMENLRKALTVLMDEDEYYGSIVEHLATYYQVNTH